MRKKKLVITNTWFKTHPRRRYTWISPGDRARNQIDYIMINEGHRTYISNARAYPGADANSDHNPVIANIKIYLKVKKCSKRKPTFSLDALHNPEIGAKFQNMFWRKYHRLKGSRIPKVNGQTLEQVLSWQQTK